MPALVPLGKSGSSQPCLGPRRHQKYRRYAIVILAATFLVDLVGVGIVEDF